MNKARWDFFLLWRWMRKEITFVRLTSGSALPPLWNYNWVSVVHPNVPCSPASPSPFAWWLNTRCHVKRAVKALPKCLCQQQQRLGASGPSLPTCSPRRKKKGSEEEKQSLRSPNDARWEPSSARFCWAALLTPTPELFLAAPGLRFSDAAILGLSAWWGPSSCLQQEKKSRKPNCEINKERNQSRLSTVCRKMKHTILILILPIRVIKNKQLCLQLVMTTRLSRHHRAIHRRVLDYRWDLRNLQARHFLKTHLKPPEVLMWRLFLNVAISVGCYYSKYRLSLIYSENFYHSACLMIQLALLSLKSTLPLWLLIFSSLTNFEFLGKIYANEAALWKRDTGARESRSRQ